MADYSQLVVLVAMVAVFYFLLIRPQQKRTKERNAMISALKKGDQVITIGGLHGTITDLDDSTATLRVSETTKVKFERSAIASVTAAKEAATAE
jgi:preprotein translocase subunit YajC